MDIKHFNSGSDFGSSMPARQLNLNSLAANSPKFWSRRMQVIHNKEVTFRQTANFEERGRLKVGTIVDRPKKSRLSVQDYVKQTAFTTEDIASTSDTLTIDKAKIVPFYVDDIDEIQNVYKAATEWADEGGSKLGSEVDADYNAEYVNAASSVDDADISGGTAGNGISLSVSNVLKMFAIAGRKLDDKNVKGPRFANVSPFVVQIVTEHLAGKDSALGDSSSLGGHVGKFMGFNLFKTTNLTGTAVLTLATDPTDGDTIVINGVTCTAQSTIGSTAGNFLTGTSADASRLTLAGLINNPGTTSASQVAFDNTAPTDQDPSDRERMRRITATDDATANTMTLEAIGVGNLVLSETLTAAADVWTAATELQRNMFGRIHAIDVVIQEEISVKFKDVPDKLGQNIVPWNLYGIHTFNEGKQALVDVLVRSDSLTSFPV